MSNYEKYENESGGIDHTDRDTLHALYWDEGLSYSQIADVVDISTGGVQYWMEKHEIETRDRVEAVRKSKSQPYATYTHNSVGYPMWTTGDGACLVSRLLAVSECGFEAVCDSEVHHKNGVPWDNRPPNIEVKTSLEHRQEHAILSPEDVKAIKNKLSEGVDKHDLSETYGVHKNTINDIEFGRSWLNIEP